jgi:type VI secretion system protein VasI
MRFGWLLVLVFALDGWAQTSPEECSKIVSDAERLACYDLNFQTQVETQSGIGEWQVETEINPMDDSRTVTMILLSSSGERGYRGAPVLVLRCQSNRTDVYINWRDFLGSDDIRVTTRIGSEEPVTRRWSLSTDKTASFYRGSDVEFIQSMFGAERLVAQTIPYNSDPVTAIFNITGLEMAVAELRAACDW